MKFIDLFNLSTRMFKARTSRTLLTVLGMSIGIAAILFLVSLGYGLQKTLLERITTSDSILTLDVSEARGNGPLDAFVKGFIKESGLEFSVDEYAEHAIGHSAKALAIAYIKIGSADGRIALGAGIDSNISLASIKATVSALNRLP